MLSLSEHPHRRFNPLTNEWVLVSPHRTHRPWQGQVEELPPETLPKYDPNCYLCPGNTRAGGVRNPNYDSIFVFENDFAALQPHTPSEEFNVQGVIHAQGEPGVCRVMCFSPRHDLTLASMSSRELRAVIEGWVEQYSEIGSLPFVSHVQIFENRGAMMGASNPHPHCQIWGNQTLPNEPAKEQAALAAYQERRGKCLLCEYAGLEMDAADRLIFADENFVVVVPFWAVWPFETLVIARRHVAHLGALSTTERAGAADALQRVTAGYDRLFGVPFPYSMGFHQQPTDGRDHPEWHLHAHFYPPLLRSATIRKFMVGYEMLGTPQRDITPEKAAEQLRAAQEAQLASAS